LLSGGLSTLSHPSLQRKEPLGYQKLFITVLEKQKDFVCLGSILKVFPLATVFGNSDEYIKQGYWRQLKTVSVR
jgi:hypothetical protein